MKIFQDFGINWQQPINELTIKIREHLKEIKRIQCPKCSSSNIRKDGFANRKNMPKVQMYACKDCKRKFNERTNTPFYWKQHQEGVILFSIWLFFNFGSINLVVKLIAEMSYNSCYSWIKEINEILMKVKFKKEQGIAKADEMYFNAYKKRVYICGIKKEDSVFLEPMEGISSLELSSVIHSSENFIGEISELWTDGCDGYIDATRWNRIRHERVVRKKEGFVSKDGIHTNDEEGFWSILRNWLRMARGYKTKKGLRRSLKGYCCYYSIRNDENFGKSLLFLIVKGENFLFSWFILCIWGKNLSLRAFHFLQKSLFALSYYLLCSLLLKAKIQKRKSQR